MDSEKNFTEHLTKSIIHILHIVFVYYIFVLPLHLWKKSVIRLSVQREKNILNVDKSISPWPFVSFLKNLCLEFCIDALICISYILGPVIAILWIIIGIITDAPAGQLFLSVLGILFVSYFNPINLSIIRDLCQFLILPFRKLLSWLAKPAQYMDLKIENNPDQSKVNSPPNN